MAFVKPWTKEQALQALADFVERTHRYPLAREANSSNELPTRKSFEAAVGMSYNDYGWKYYSDLMEKNQLNHKSSSVLSRQILREGDFYGMLLAVQHFYLEHGRMPEQAEYTSENGLPSYAIFTHYALDAFTTDIEKGLKSSMQSRSKAKQRGDARYGRVREHFFAKRYILVGTGNHAFPRYFLFDYCAEYGAVKGYVQG